MNSAKIFKNGIIDENPTFVQVIGMCPTPVSYTHLDVYKRQHEFKKASHNIYYTLLYNYNIYFRNEIFS